MNTHAAFLGLGCFLVCATPGGLAAQNRLAPDSLILRPGDGVRLEIRDEPQLSGEFTVGSDGQVLFPVLGFRTVAGRAFAEVSRELTVGYQRELVEPVLRLTPLVRIAVLGEVQRPGLFPVDPTFSLADVLATAGGLLPTANRRKVALVRDGRVVAAQLDPGSTTLALSIQSGDQVIVGRRSWISENLPIFIGAITSVAAAAVTSLIVTR